MCIAGLSLKGRQCHCQAGFTLLEVLVATAVLGICVGTIMLIFSQGSSSVFRAQGSVTASEMASLLLDTWQKGGYPMEEEGELSGFPGWRYSFSCSAETPEITVEPVGVEGKDGNNREGGGVFRLDSLRLAELKLLPPGRTGTGFVIQFLLTESELQDRDGVE